MKPKKQGQTLVEVLVATVIAATTAMAVFSVLLSSFASQKKADKREAAGFMLKQAQETLKSYVSAVPGEADYSPNAGGVWSAEPGSNWALLGSPAGITHNITALLQNTPLNDNDPSLPAPSFTYTVTDINCGFGTGSTACKRVQFTLIYQDM
ncbi:MAG: hypothetical protein A2021_00495 [Elusimicrobia bacterium GWF2_52_66]|nr:MAG: hypothetical protein A2X33_06130 [Elusimicrobia bacterium GWA2_51_34]OGR85207.1 MAG: hypothetical protein A2021_00495 [Elusimicrobia bacterium GWF2_52_66]HAF94753.1 hypothetical protein [Elusimicrobiota bacterium]HCE97637.1 hypothetical protein [Elusimicrobiota bacterium]